MSAQSNFLTLIFVCVVRFSDNPDNLRQLASLPSNAPLWVLLGAQDELAEAELRYIGPLSGGSSALYFGVELKVTFEGWVPRKTP